ncbi:hypothetical protein H2201_006528 [Coniosporium apollinis]|uniref:Alpha-galactosidase n=1 Tax=Coniosporium apollinis TaxID=61459 RepID=A0ABQ9NLQ6_9PEZI|nr:hypothetical protein H2201_006528 [Coniosporium apollinis]
MSANLVCSPPLGQTTIIPADAESVVITACIETEAASEKSWEVALWCNHANSDRWKSFEMKETDEHADTLVVQQKTQSGLRRHWFSVSLTPRPKPTKAVSFTLKFRAAGDEAWQWANEQLSLGDGQLIFEPETISDQELSFYINGMSSELSVKKEASETSDTLLWSLEAPVEAASGETSGCSNHKLGTVTNFSRWFALVRLWSPWLAPRHGKDVYSPDKDAILSAFLRQDGLHVAALAVSGVDDVLTTFTHDNQGNVIIKVSNDSEREGTARVIVAVAKSFGVANASVMYHARKIITRYEQDSGELKAELEAMEKKDLKGQWLEDWYDGLSYCTWNGLGQNLTEDKIHAALASLEKNNINITNLIIDDNWQSLDHEGGGQFQRGWLEFEANKNGFPNGLKSAVTKIREDHKNIVHVAVWHALMGYWGGISSDGQIAKEYKTTTVRNKPGVTARSMLVVDAPDINRMYLDFYRFLERCGISSVKTDAQFALDELASAVDRRRLTRPFQDAWTLNSLRVFYGHAISCMSQLPQILFHSQIPTNKPRLLVRNSDDFFPDQPASHPWHVFCNAHNSLLTQHLNVLPDWDMFQTAHPWARFHAAARCVSGGPIYITDVPGEHDIDLINEMTAQTPRGNTVILRPHVVGKTINAYVGYDEAALLKVGTYVGMQKTGTGILGVFNTTQHPLKDLIRLEEFPGTEVGVYVVRSHSTGQVSAPMSRQRKDKPGLVSVEVGVQGWEILSAFALRSFQLKRSSPAKGSASITVANLGLLGKMTGAAAVVNTEIYVEQRGRLHFWTSLKALGTFGLYVSDLENRSLEDDFMALLFGRPIELHCVRISSACKNVLEIDVARAWKESEQRAGWSNEVAIEVLIR